jgi:hypothetical protein
MSTKISQLPTAATLAGTEQISLVQNGTTKKVTWNALTSQVNALQFVSGGSATGPACLNFQAFGVNLTGNGLFMNGTQALASDGSLCDRNGNRLVNASVGRQAAIANATNATDVITQLNALLTALRNLGLITPQP